MAEGREHLFRRIVRHFWAPVPWMLEATIVLQVAVGERIEAVLIAVLLGFNVALGAFQESRANAALALLKQHLSLKTRVRGAKVAGLTCQPLPWSRTTSFNCR